nr:MAG TPA: hypothetical protein [Caudoviricetes sp.]
MSCLSFFLFYLLSAIKTHSLMKNLKGGDLR